MSRLAWLTPVDAPGELVPHIVYTPGGLWYDAAVRGALLLLADPVNWELFGATNDPQTVADAYMQGFALTLRDWDKPMWNGEGSLLATHEFYSSVSVNQDTDGWFPFSVSDLKMTVVLDRDATIEIHWLLSGLRLAGAPSPGKIDIGKHVGSAYVPLSGEAGGAQFQVGDRQFFHLTNILALTAGTHDFWLLSAGSNTTYPNRINANAYTLAWAILR